jgi:hypothetical protein
MEDEFSALPEEEALLLADKRKKWIDLVLEAPEEEAERRAASVVVKDSEEHFCTRALCAAVVAAIRVQMHYDGLG